MRTLLLLLSVLGSSSIQAATSFSCPEDGGLTDEMIQSYNKNGYLILDKFLSPEDCKKSIKETLTLIDQFTPNEKILSIFSTSSETNSQDTSDYFSQSATNISFFFEKDAILNNKLILDKTVSINKIGHNLHELNPLFKAITFSEKVQNIARSLDFWDPVVAQSMVIIKPPKIGGDVVAHQDSTFLYTSPLSLAGFWVPFEDATIENGCLWGIPGSQKYSLSKQYIHNKELKKNTFTVLQEANWNNDLFIPLEMKAGSLVIFPGTFVHKSEKNQSNDKSRIAYSWHIFDNITDYSQQNWLKRDSFPKLLKQE
jgi:phytanoyl-CoA hydroxylase